MKNRNVRLISGGILLLVCGGIFFSFWALGPFRGQGTYSMIISQGQSLRSIADSLHSRQIINSPKALIAYMRLRGSDRLVQAGKVTLSRGRGVPAVSRQLLDAEALEEKVTIIEGLTIWQTAETLHEQLGLDSTRFIALCTDSLLLDSLGLAGRNSAEGYLFPQTYFFPREATEKQVVSRLVQFGLEQTRSLRHIPFPPTIATWHELITLASIVEREAMVRDEQRRIAAVFHNRLEKRMPLGADPTVRYALRKFSGPLRVSELKNPHPYNTRFHAGLPPGPICSPGIEAIKATIDPIQSAELYFVAKWDGSGEHDFSKTLSEHNRKKIQARKTNAKRIKNQQ